MSCTGVKKNPGGYFYRSPQYHTVKQLKEEWRSESQPNIGDNYHHSAEGVYLGFKTLRGRKQGLAPYIQVTNQRKKIAKEKKELWLG